jgi:hypothetical protein
VSIALMVGSFLPEAGRTTNGASSPREHSLIRLAADTSRDR